MKAPALLQCVHSLYLVYEAVQHFGARLEIGDKVLHLPLQFVGHK